MNNIPLRKESLIPRIDGITNNLKKLRELGENPLSEFEKHGDVFDLSQHHLRLALEGVFHIGSHILSRLSGARATSYKEIAVNLGEKGIVEISFANNQLIKMAGYRTRLTHFYHDVTPKELYEIIHNNLSDIESFLSVVKEIILNPQKIGLKIE